MMNWNTIPTPTQAKAYLGNTETSAIFSFNPDEVKWSYKNNTVSRDTIGGRVVQILSSNVETMSISARAGSREKLQTLTRDFQKVMQYHVKTGDPVDFKVPSRNWQFTVFLQNVAPLGWDVGATSYPFQMVLAIKQDLNGVAAQKIREDAFLNLAEGIGYNPRYHGGDSASAMQYVESMLGAIESIDLGGGSSAYEDTGIDKGKYNFVGVHDGNGNNDLAKELVAEADLTNVPKVIIPDNYQITLKEVYALAYWALEQMGNLSGDSLKQKAIISTAISYCETQTHNTRAYNPNATDGKAYGLWQMNNRYGSSLFDPVVAALLMAKTYYASEWLYWGCGPNHSGDYSRWLDASRDVAS